VLLLAIALWGIVIVQADLPIHCLHSQALGTWEFHLAKPSANRDENCSYQRPDDNIQHFSRYQYKLEPDSTLSIRLSEPNVASIVGTEKKGTWTMVYDEGFEVKIDDQVFFAFFAYRPNSAKDLHSTKVKDYTSYCDRTMVGWYRSADLKRWGCFQAQKPGVAAWIPPQFDSSGKQQLESDAVVAPSGFLETDSATTSHVGQTITSNTASKTRMFVADLALIAAVNADTDSTWQAGVPVIMLGKTQEEVLTMNGRDRFQDESNLLEGGAGKEGGVLRHNSRGTGSIVYSQADARVEKEYNLPKEVDHRKHMLVRSQGRCGSCYAFAIAAASEGRLNMQTGKRMLLSPQSMLSCSVTNQGCNGGYPYLLAKHAHEHGLVPESCFPYQMRADCSKQCSDSEVFYGSSNYGYVGGYYGASEEVAMMEEVAHNGPFVVALQAPRALSYYKSGVFKCDKLKLSLFEEGWEHTNHAVILVGYGVDQRSGLNIGSFKTRGVIVGATVVILRLPVVRITVPSKACPWPFKWWANVLRHRFQSFLSSNIPRPPAVACYTVL